MIGKSGINFSKIDAAVANLCVQLFPFFLIMEGENQILATKKNNLVTMNKLPILFAALLLLSSCEAPPDTGRDFLENLGEYCGYSYEGRTTEFSLGQEGEPHPLEDPRMVMVLEECSEDEIRIPFHVDEDQSRTWVLQMRDDQLHLSHDHRYPDGTEYDQNMYGGYSDARGTGLKHYFPADDFTITERPQRNINVWSMEIDPEGDTFWYRLYLQDVLRFEATFDLGDPRPIP